MTKQGLKVAGNKREVYDVKTFVVIVQKNHDGVTHPSIECVEEASWEGPDSKLLKINMFYHVSKPGCGEMMNSLISNRDHNLPSPK